jgi:hypothetical protein
MRDRSAIFRIVAVAGRRVATGKKQGRKAQQRQQQK